MAGMEPSGDKHNRTLSLHLSHVLHEIGVSERTVNKSRETFLKLEKLQSIYKELTDNKDSISLDYQYYFFGSQIEGSTTIGLSSDTDGMECITGVAAIQNVREWKWGKLNVLVLQGGDIPAGYCRLQYFDSPYLPVQEIPLLLNECFTIDGKGRVLLKRFKIEKGPEYTIHGPAATLSGNAGINDVDIVTGIKCDSVSQQVEPWIRRMTNKQWPTPDMLETAKDSGFFLVPVGHRLSETDDRDVEWRVSPSLTERCLMLGMNITQIKCYIILKMIKKDLIVPNIGESITSFHMKTVLFHCVESTPHDFWREDNLLACINICLGYLLKCVKKRSCPNFLIPGENLFSGRMTEEQIPGLEELLCGFIESNGRYLNEITCDQVGNMLMKYHNSPSMINQDIDILNEAATLGWSEYSLKRFHVETIMQALSSSVNVIQERLWKLQKHQKSSDCDIKSFATILINAFYSNYGSILASWCIRAGIGLSQGALSYLERGCRYDSISGRLKYASALYCKGEYDKAASMLEDIESRYDFLCVQQVCHCHVDRPQQLKMVYVRCIFFGSTNVQTADHVAFVKHDIHCCPKALRFEMFRGVGDDQALRRQDDAWMDMAAVDSVICLHFLMYMTYGRLRNCQRQLSALDKLSRSLSYFDEKLYLRHLETAYNLLGQCFEMEGMPDYALWLYRRSLQLVPRNNAAKCLVTLLIYKHFYRQLFGVRRIISHLLNDLPVK